MYKIPEKDKKVWDFYTSHLNSIKKNAIKVSSEISLKIKSKKTLRNNQNFLLDYNISKKLSNKEFKIDAILDLHGKSEKKAYEEVKIFINKCFSNELKNLIIVTGKGKSNKGILKLNTPNWLLNNELSKFIVGFEVMPEKKGGEGALFVKLKNRKKYNL
tara:strand:+ start:1613 stop:2089 length:477 start_codon:yes stop_codon:yes gene_type:complete